MSKINSHSLKGSASSNLVSSKSIGHFGLRTIPENFDAMVQWHEQFFGGSIVLKNDIAAMMTLDDEHHRLVIVQDARHIKIENKRAATGIYHIAFTLASLADLATSYEQKKARNILPHWSINHGMSTSMYYFDPDENEFEMQVDNFDSAEEAHEFMITPEYTQNPIAVDMVVDDFIQSVRSGEDEANIKRRPVIGPRGSRWEKSLYFKPEDKWN